MSLEAHEKWFSQGDVFEAAPVLVAAVDETGRLRARFQDGPAVLLTQGCQMDKANPKTGAPKFDRLQFATLRLVEELDNGAQSHLRGKPDEIWPNNRMWVGEVKDWGESFISLMDPYWVPVDYFGVHCVNYPGLLESGEPARPRGTPNKNDSRIGRLSEERVTLLHLKMQGFWTDVRDEDPRGFLGTTVGRSLVRAASLVTSRLPGRPGRA